MPGAFLFHIRYMSCHEQTHPRQVQTTGPGKSFKTKDTESETLCPFVIWNLQHTPLSNAQRQLSKQNSWTERVNTTLGTRLWSCTTGILGDPELLLNKSPFWCFSLKALTGIHFSEVTIPLLGLMCKQNGLC